MLCATLRFYATGSIVQVAADFSGIHTSTCGKIIHKVSNTLAHLRPDYIRMPQNEEEIVNTRQGFYNISRFPRCIGALDCTHIKLQSPGGEDPEIYRIRKGFFSMNVQAICNADLQFLNLVARWPGSAHDSTIFNNSRIRATFENAELGDNLIIGDSGYPIKPYLIV